MSTETTPEEAIKKNPQLIWAAVYGALSCGIPWMVLTTFFVLFAGLPTLSYLAGPFIWMIVWATGGMLISRSIHKESKPFTVGTIYGSIVGAMTGVIFVGWIYWPQEGRVQIDPEYPPYIGALGMPTIFIRDALYLLTGIESFAFLHIFSSMLFWAMFGLILAKFIKSQEE